MRSPPLVAAGDPTVDADLSPPAHWQEARVRQVRRETDRIRSYELVPVDDGHLATFTAGAHIDLRIEDDVVRQYSLCNDPSEADRYLVAVLRSEQANSGSRLLHERIVEGSRILVSRPRNHFRLDESAKHTVLLGGGIGITPLLSMAYRLRQLGLSFELHYCTRSPAETALARDARRVAGSRLTLHHDGGRPGRGADLRKLLSGHADHTHVYVCGPPTFMEAARAATMQWGRANVHFEHFTPQGAASTPESAFVVRLAKSGVEYMVPAEQSIVEVLRAHGVLVETLCESGVCGACKTRYLAGDPDHRDVVLDEKDRVQFVMPCCSRSRTSVLVLDI